MTECRLPNGVWRLRQLREALGLGPDRPLVLDPDMLVAEESIIEYRGKRLVFLAYGEGDPNRRAYVFRRWRSSQELHTLCASQVRAAVAAAGRFCVRGGLGREKEPVDPLALTPGVIVHWQGMELRYLRQIRPEGRVGPYFFGYVFELTDDPRTPPLEFHLMASQVRAAAPTGA